MSEPLAQAGIALSRYGVGSDLEIAGEINLRPGELLLYVNYFGIKSAYCRNLVRKYGRALLIDNSQAFFAAPLDCGATFYSPRKFFGVADGGYLYAVGVLDESLESDVSFDSARQLLGRLDRSAAEFFQDYRRSEQRLAGRPLRLMSTLTRAILSGVDYERARLVRERNFLFLHAVLQPMNHLPIDTAEARGPMVYPLLSDDSSLRQRLLARSIYVATYWPEVLESAEATVEEKRLAAQLIPLPIDQRYGIEQMQAVLDVVLDRTDR
jgi:hypothetical protein